MNLISGMLQNINNRMAAKSFDGTDGNNRDIEKATDRGRKTVVTNPNSKRWSSSYSDNPDLTSDDVADMDEQWGSSTDLQEHSVESTAVHSVSYDPKTGDLGVVFQPGNGKEYIYPNVPKEVYKEFMDATSKGKYLCYELAPKYGV